MTQLVTINAIPLSGVDVSGEPRFANGLAKADADLLACTDKVARIVARIDAGGFPPADNYIAIDSRRLIASPM